MSLVTTDLSFSKATELAKKGARIARAGWNGKNMFVFKVSGPVVQEAINKAYARFYFPTNETKALDALYMFTADGSIVPWLASQTDILSNDWTVLDILEEAAD